MKLNVFFPDRLQIAVQRELERWAAVISTTWRVQHNDDGTHGFVWTDYTPQFFADTGTWTVDATDIVNMRYVAMGNVMFMSVVLAFTTTSNATASLSISMPAGVTIFKSTHGGFYFDENGTRGIGHWRADRDTHQLFFHKSDHSNWNAVTNLLLISGTMIVEIA